MLHSWTLMQDCRIIMHFCKPLRLSPEQDWQLINRLQQRWRDVTSRITSLKIVSPVLSVDSPCLPWWNKLSYGESHVSKNWEQPTMTDATVNSSYCHKKPVVEGLWNTVIRSVHFRVSSWFCHLTAVCSCDNYNHLQMYSLHLSFSRHFCSWEMWLWKVPTNLSHYLLK